MQLRGKVSKALVCQQVVVQRQDPQLGALLHQVLDHPHEHRIVDASVVYANDMTHQRHLLRLTMLELLAIEDRMLSILTSETFFFGLSSDLMAGERMETCCSLGECKLV